MISLRHIMFTAALFTAACNPPAPPAGAPQGASQGASQGATPDQVAATSAPAGKPDDDAKPTEAAPAQAGALTAAMLIGRWGDNGDCTKDIVFHPNGAFSSYTGGQGTWRLVGDVVSMSGPGGTFDVRVQIINNSQLLITNPDGSIGTSQRC